MHRELGAAAQGKMQMQTARATQHAHSAARNTSPALRLPSLLQLTEENHMFHRDPTASEFSRHFHFRVLHPQLWFQSCPSMQVCANQF